MEKANYFLEAVARHAGPRRRRPHGGAPALRADQDGGQWNMFVALVRKHGLVPQSAMPETDSSSNTARTERGALTRLLRKGSRDLRALADGGADLERLQELKESTSRGGAPDARDPPRHPAARSSSGSGPTRSKTFHRDGVLTPLEFAERYVTISLDDYVCVVHDPRPSSEPGRTYTVEFLGNVVGAPPVVYLNVEIDLLRTLAMKTIVGGEPVWFGCDTGKMTNSELGRLGRGALRLRRRLRHRPVDAEGRPAGLPRLPDDARDAVRRRRRRRRRTPQVAGREQLGRRPAATRACGR